MVDTFKTWRIYQRRLLMICHVNIKWASTSHRRNACLRRYSIWSGHDLDLWPVTLKTFSAMPNHMMNICAKFHWNLSTEYRGGISAREIGVNGQRPDGRAAYLETYCLYRGFFNGGSKIYEFLIERRSRLPAIGAAKNIVEDLLTYLTFVLLYGQRVLNLWFVWSV